MQTIFATVVVLFFALTGRDPYTGLYGLMALLGTTAILIVQALAAFAVIAYFPRRQAPSRDGQLVPDVPGAAARRHRDALRHLPAG